MSTKNIKAEARELIEKLPDDMSWDDLMQAIFVRQSSEAGMVDSEAGRTTDLTEVRAKFSL